MTDKALRLVLADDHPIFREGLRSLIGARQRDVGRRRGQLG